MPEFRFESREDCPPVVVDCALQVSQPVQQLHATRVPILMGGRWYFACPCGCLKPDGQATAELARQEACAFFRAEREARTNALLFGRVIGAVGNVGGA